MDMNIFGRIVLVIRCCGRRQSLKLPRPIRGISAQFFMQTSKEICGKFSCYSHPLCRWALKQEVLPSPPKEFTVHAFVYVRMCLHDCAMCVDLPPDLLAGKCPRRYACAFVDRPVRIILCGRVCACFDRAAASQRQVIRAAGLPRQRAPGLPRQRAAA